MTTAAYQFTEFQRKRLQLAGLAHAHIDALEARAIRAVAQCNEPARLAEARRTLERLQADSSRLLKTLEAMTPLQLPRELDTARLFLLMAHFDRDGALPTPTPIPESLLAHLTELVEVATRALAKSREKHERDHSASPEPIRYIVRLIEDTRPPIAPMTADRLREIASVCYEAAGRQNTDPERAVRAYLQQEKQGLAALAERLNLP